ncbi:MAG: nucleoside hydrolase [Chloroflexi bacterium]|nr:nucleoside hydrolase [Chloroflexota bacterium]
MTPQKIIIDTDPGIDDAMAIFFALNSPELELIGLTTIFGNGFTDLTTTNALRLLEIAERPDIPVAVGAAQPVADRFDEPGSVVHGDDGQGNVHLPPPTAKPVDQNAAAFIIEQVMRAPREVTLVPIGPLTNIALALHLEPRIATAVREVVIMGGNALVPGNITPAAEANIFHDPEAADTVFGTSWPVTMVGLDVTQKTVMSSEQLGKLAQSTTATAQHLSAIIPFYQDFTLKANKFHGIYLHDPTTLAYLVAKDAFQTLQRPVRVETQGFSRGKTWIANDQTNKWSTAWQNRPPVNVCIGVNGPQISDLILERLM